MEIHFFESKSRRLILSGFCSFLVGWFCCLGELNAQPSNHFDYNPGRPAFTTGSGILIPLTLSLETGFAFSIPLPTFRGGDMENYYMLRYAPLPFMELSVLLSYGLDITASGKTQNVDMRAGSLGAKFNILKKKDGGRPGLALYASVELPLSRMDTAARRYPIPTLAIFMDHSWHHFSIGYNVGSRGFDGLFYSLYAEYTCHPRVCVFAEFIGKHQFFQSPQVELNGNAISYEKTSQGHLTYQMGAAFYLLPGLKADLALGTTFLNISAQKGSTTAVAQCYAIACEVGLAYGIPLKKVYKPQD